MTILSGFSWPLSAPVQRGRVDMFMHLSVSKKILQQDRVNPLTTVLHLWMLLAFFIENPCFLPWHLFINTSECCTYNEKHAVCSRFEQISAPVSWWGYVVVKQLWSVWFCFVQFSKAGMLFLEVCTGYWLPRIHARFAINNFYSHQMRGKSNQR